jgi:hypothetical protein
MVEPKLAVTKWARARRAAEPAAPSSSRARPRSPCAPVGSPLHTFYTRPLEGLYNQGYIGGYGRRSQGPSPILPLQKGGVSV